MEFVAATARKRECPVALSDVGEIGRKIGEALCHEMDDLALALKEMGRFREAAVILQQMPAPGSPPPLSVPPAVR